LECFCAEVGLLGVGCGEEDDAKDDAKGVRRHLVNRTVVGDLLENIDNTE